MSEKILWEEQYGIEWLEIEQEYITAKKKISMRKLASKHFPDRLKYKAKSEEYLKKLNKQLEWQAANCPRGRWTDQRKAYWENVSEQVLGHKSDDDIEQIRNMRQQERQEIATALQISESLVNRLKQRLNASQGSYLFPELNTEENLDLFKHWADNREKIQKMLYRSWDIADRMDLRTSDSDSESAAAALLERMYGSNPADANSNEGS